MGLKKYLANFLTLIYFFVFKIKYDIIIFSHVPQCGGNSILHVFKFFLGYRFLNIHRKDIEYFKKNPKKLKKKLNGKILILGHFGVDFVSTIEKLYNKKRVYYMLNIRNPKNRYLSNYYRNKKLNNLSISLLEFLKKRRNEKLDNLYVRFLSGKNIYQPGKTKINKKIFLIANQNIKKFDSIIFLENLKFDMQLVIKKLFYFNIFSNLFFSQKNKVSDSRYKKVSKLEKNIISKLTYYDNLIYKNLIKKYENTKI